MSDPEGPVLAWHWLRADRRLGYEDRREVVDGETLSAPDMSRAPKCCYYGMHASERVVDALPFAPGCILTRVEVSGEISRQQDKLVGRNRKVLWSLTVKQGLDLVVAFAQWCAARAKQHANAAANAAAYAAAEQDLQEHWLLTEIAKLHGGEL